MDPLSQGALGSSLPQALTGDGKAQRYAGLAGFVAGMAPDLDVLIRSDADPLLFLEYHRQFSHALIFIPVGGLICALVLYPFLRRRLGFGRLYLFATLGYGTHGLLDTCTSYGTQLFWPFSDYRAAWNNVSVVDPLFTLPLVLLVGAAFWRRRARWARVGLAWAVLYLLVGVAQGHRAERAGEALAQARGHRPQRLEAKPTLGNLVLWKLVYEAEGRIFVDAVHVLGETRVIEGASVPRLDVARDFPSLPAGSVQRRDLARFAWFSDGWVAVRPDQPDVVADVRYSLVPNEIAPLWGVRIDPARPGRHVRFENFREDLPDKRDRFLSLLLGGGHAGGRTD